jgi:hypothetical protein
MQNRLPELHADIFLMDREKWENPEVEGKISFNTSENWNDPFAPNA